MIYNVQSREDLAEYVSNAGEKLVVMDFYANWCGPCKLIAPQLEELSSLYTDQAIVLKINVDECEEIAEDYNVTSMPTFVFMKDNQVIDIFVGGNAEKLAKHMDKYVNGGIATLCSNNNLNPIREDSQSLE